MNECENCAAKDERIKELEGQIEELEEAKSGLEDALDDVYQTLRKYL